MPAILGMFAKLSTNPSSQSQSHSQSKKIYLKAILLPMKPCVTMYL